MRTGGPGARAAKYTPAAARRCLSMFDGTTSKAFEANRRGTALSGAFSLLGQ